MKYQIDYLDDHGDMCHCWLDAHDEKDAEARAIMACWDLDTIINIKKSTK